MECTKITSSTRTFFFCLLNVKPPPCQRISQRIPQSRIPHPPTIPQVKNTNYTPQSKNTTQTTTNQDREVSDERCFECAFDQVGSISSDRFPFELYLVPHTAAHDQICLDASRQRPDRELTIDSCGSLLHNTGVMGTAF